VSTYVTLLIWDPLRHEPRPASLADAQEIVLRLGSMVDTVNPRFIELAGRVSHHLKGEDDWELKQLAESLPVEAAKHETALFEVSFIPSIENEELMDFIRTCCKELDLFIYVNELEQVFLPNGVVLPEPPSINDIKNSHSALLLSLNESLEAAITDHHFKRIEVKSFIVFGRSVGCGYQLIREVCDHFSVYETANFNFSMSCLAVEKVFEDARIAITPFIFSFQTNWFIDDKFIRSSELIHAPVKYLERVRADVLPILDKAKDIHGLDQVVNGNLFPNFRDCMHRKFRLQSLVIARLAGNPSFDELVLSFQDSSRQQWSRLYHPDFASKLTRLVKHLQVL
jgi:hypothetical protein